MNSASTKNEAKPQKKPFRNFDKITFKLNTMINSGIRGPAKRRRLNIRRKRTGKSGDMNYKTQPLNRHSESMSLEQTKPQESASSLKKSSSFIHGKGPRREFPSLSKLAKNSFSTRDYEQSILSCGKQLNSRVKDLESTEVDFVQEASSGMMTGKRRRMLRGGSGKMNKTGGLDSETKGKSKEERNKK